MVQMSARLQVECTASDEYFPKNLTRNQKYNVVGTMYFNYVKDTDGRPETKHVIKFLVVNDADKLQQITADNCKVFPVAPSN